MTPPRRPVGRPPYNPRKACAAMRGVGDAAPLQGAPRTFRRPLPNGIPLFRFALQGGVLTPPRRPEGWPPYDLPESVCRHAGRRGRRPLQGAPRTFRGPRPPGTARSRLTRREGFIHPAPCASAAQTKTAQGFSPCAVIKNVTPFSRRSAFSARPESRPAAPPAWGRRGQQAPPRRAPHACPSPSACS